MVDVDDQISDSVNVCLSFEEGKWETEELLDCEAILWNQSMLVEVDSVVGNVEDEGVSAVKHFGAFVVHLLRSTKQSRLAGNPDDGLLCLIRNFDS